MSAPDGHLMPQAWMQAEETRRVMAALGPGQARFVGGCVRDALCNRPVTDIDIATPLKPEAVIEKLDAAGLGHAPTGLKHGTVTALCGEKHFEITTLRIDVTPFGRHAAVRFTDDWKTDAARRDFTINAMSATTEGDVFDYFGGIADLREGRVVFVGEAEKRIEEDVLRILRFYRFFAWYGRGLPDAEAVKACAHHARLLPRLSGERLRQETLKILQAPRAAEVWRLMLSAGAVTQYLPEATNLEALERLAALEQDGGAYALRRLAALLVLEETGLKQVISTLRLSREEGMLLWKMAFPPALPTVLDAPAVRALVYREGNDLALSHLLLAAAKGRDIPDLRGLTDLATSFRPHPLPVEGDDVLKLGHAPGPDVGRALKEVEAWWIAQDFAPGRTECLARLAGACGHKTHSASE